MKLSFILCLVYMYCFQALQGMLQLQVFYFYFSVHIIPVFYFLLGLYPSFICFLLGLYSSYFTFSGSGHIHPIFFFLLFVGCFGHVF